MAVYTPVIPGMNQNAASAAVQGAATGAVPGGAVPDPGAGGWTSSTNGTIFNTQTGDVQGPGMFGQGGMAQMGLGAIKTLGSLWNSFQQQKIAKKSMQFQEKAYNNALGDQRKSYNTALEDRIRQQYDQERRDPGEADKYIAKNKL